MTATSRLFLVPVLGALCIGAVGQRDLPPEDSPQPIQVSQDEPLPPGALIRLGTSRYWLPSFPGYESHRVHLSPDGRRLAVILAEGLTLMDLETGKIIWSKPSPTGTLKFVSFSSDGSSLVTADYKGSVHLWDPQTGKLVDKLSVPASERGWDVRAVVGSGNKLTLLAEHNWPGMFHKVLVWEINRNKTGIVVQADRSFRACTALSADGKTVVVWGENKYVKAAAPDSSALYLVQVWNATTGKELRRFEVHARDDGPPFAALSPDGKLLAVARTERTISVWDTASGKKIQHCLEQPPAVTKAKQFYGSRAMLSFSPDGKFLSAATGAGHGSVHVSLWNTQSWELVGGSPGPPYVVGVAFPPSGKPIACGNAGQAVHRWEVLSGKQLSSRQGHDTTVRSIAFRSNKIVVSAEAYSFIHWDLAKGKVSPPLNFFWHPQAVSQGDQWWFDSMISPTGKWVLTKPYQRKLNAGGPGELDPDQIPYSLWETSPWKLAGSLPGSEQCVKVAFSANGSRVAGLSRKDEVLVWDTVSRKKLHCLPLKEDVSGAHDSCRLVLSTDGRKLAAVISGWKAGKFADHTSVHLWDLEQGTKLPVFETSNVKDPTLAFSPDGKQLAWSAAEGIVLWDLASGKQMRRLNSPIVQHVSLVFSPDGRMLAAGATGKNDVAQPITLWELASGKVRCQWKGHSGTIQALAFSDDSTRLASGGDDTMVVVWDASGRYLVGSASPAKAEVLWSALGQEDAEKAFRAIGELTSRPEVALPLLKNRLPELAKQVLSEAGIRKLIDDLDSESFKTRDKATHTLIKMGSAALPFLHEATGKKGIKVEMQMRLDKLREHLMEIPFAPYEIQDVRAVEILERIGNDEARAFLKQLAAGMPHAAITGQARDALARVVFP